MVASRIVSARRDVDLCAEETLTDAHGRRKVATAPEILAPHLFVALECDRLDAGVARHSLANVDRVLLGRGSRRVSTRSFEAGSRVLTISIPDACMSTRHACIERRGTAFAAADLGSRNGIRVNGALLSEQSPLNDEALIQVGHTILRFREAISVPVGEPEDADLADGDGDGACALSTVDPCLARRARALARVARSKAAVLLLGETGTGKEVLARATHRLSGRKGPFVAVNCGAIPATLLEAQLFGHVRGAFSGACADAMGLLRSADGGTLFLDEAGDLPLPAQAALLRALQEQEVVPIGGIRSFKVDFRVVSATHQPLEQMVARGQFRGDVFARIAAFVFPLPALRQRREDIGQMIAAFARDRNVRLTVEAARALVEYDWPLNIRELHQVLDVAVALAGDGEIEPGDLPETVTQRRFAAGALKREAQCPESLRAQLLAALARHHGNVSEVARELRKERRQVQRWMTRFGIRAASFRENAK